MRYLLPGPDTWYSPSHPLPSPALLTAFTPLYSPLTTPLHRCLVLLWVQLQGFYSEHKTKGIEQKLSGSSLFFKTIAGGSVSMCADVDTGALSKCHCYNEDIGAEVRGISLIPHCV